MLSLAIITRDPNEKMEIFNDVVEDLKNEDMTVAEAVESLEQIHSDMEVTYKKIKTGANFIDFFVHDILDYTLLNNNGGKFSKMPKVVDIRESLEEILQI